HSTKLVQFILHMTPLPTLCASGSNADNRGGKSAPRGVQIRHRVVGRALLRPKVKRVSAQPVKRGQVCSPRCSDSAPGCRACAFASQGKKGQCSAGELVGPDAGGSGAPDHASLIGGRPRGVAVADGGAAAQQGQGVGWPTEIAEVAEERVEWTG